MIVFKHTGTFKLTDNFFSRALKINPRRILDTYGREGVAALSSATPKDTGETADAWDYEVKTTKNGYNISWSNSNAEFGIPVVILIQYGHGTRNGGYVQGIDFVNPALKSIFDKIAQNLWLEVTKS